jgi:pimeloyl-ACP methyl ester carboxylesterase
VNKMAWKIAAGVAGGVLLLVFGSYALLRRADIPYPKLEERWAAAGSHYANLPGGVRLHYLDQGNPGGQTVVLLHGFAMSTDTWAAWTKRLGHDYRVVTLDLPGFGLTQAPQGKAYSYQEMADVVEAFAKAKHLDKLSIGGSSMGGGVAWRFALGHPEQVRGLILVDSSGWPEPGSPVTNSPLVKASQAPGIGPVLMKLDNRSTLRSGFRNAFADPAAVDDAYVARYAELSRAPGRRAQWISLLTAWPHQDFATPERLAAIKAPTLVLWGDKDRLLPLADGRRFVAAIPGSHLIVYPGVGHLPQEEAADRSAADVSAFLHLLDPPKKPAAKPGAPSTQTITKKPQQKELLFY